MSSALGVAAHAGSGGAALLSVPAGGWQPWQLRLNRAALKDLITEMTIGHGWAAGLWVAVAHSGSAGVPAVPDAGADHQRPQKPGAVRQGGSSLILQRPLHSA